MDTPTPSPPTDRSAEFERAIADDAGEHYLLRLYVAGLSRRSQTAVSTITAVCEQYLPGRYTLEVIDIYRKPALASDEQIIAVPTLLKCFPQPLRKLIGDLTDQEQVIFGLDLRPEPQPQSPDPMQDGNASRDE